MPTNETYSSTAALEWFVTLGTADFDAERIARLDQCAARLADSESLEWLIEAWNEPITEGLVSAPREMEPDSLEMVRAMRLGLAIAILAKTRPVEIAG
jgi:hypothetical protein